MAAPINQFEIAESIRFFASLVGTPGVDAENVRIANDYIRVLLQSMESGVTEVKAKAAGITTSIYNG